MSTLTRNGADIALPMRIETDRPTCAAIKLQDMFALGIGEWFMNVLEGVPYVGLILGVKNPDISRIRALFRSIILQAPGIVDVQEINVNWNPRTRRLIYDFAAVDDTGAIVKGGDSPFIVQTGGT